MINEIIKTKELYSFRRENKIKINNNNVIQKIFNFSIIQNIKQKSETENVRNIPQLYPINNEIINSEKIFDEASYNSDPKESNKIQDIKDNIIKKHISYPHSNNEIKVLKNNKFVYINKELLNSYSTLRAIKKLKKINFIIRKNRSSKYRGVSKNGNKWQVLRNIYDK